MSNGIRSKLQHVEDAMDAANMAWWELEFPSGALSFSENKTRMLGYDKKDFFHYEHFTQLLHPEDYDDTMQAMRDHYNGNAEFYETKYRIKASDGTFKTFYDKGKIVERHDKSFVVAGMVVDVTDLELKLAKK